jgi:hypothetical protein
MIKKTQHSFTLIFLAGILILSCSSKPNIDALLTPFIGTYFFAVATEDVIIVEENCSIGTGEKFQIEKVSDVFFLYIHSFHTTNYVVQSAEKIGDEVVIQAFDQDVDGESENPEPKTFRLLKGDYITMNMDNEERLLVSVDEPTKFVYRSCQEAMENEGNPDSPDDYTVPEIDTSTKEGQILAELFKFLDPSSTLNLYFLEGQTVSLEKPGPGVKPITETIQNEKELATFVSSYLRNYSPSFLARWYKNGLVYYEALPFRCEPTNQGVFIKISTDETSKISSAEISLVESEPDSEPMTIFTLNYYWDENSNLVLTKIDIRDCGA